ncbi:purple acid phosphatase family protein [Methanospirillum lacunae]|uniref:Fibronectin type-III domain-containing protein n=1 Tax=Methanospirillum lacunae TaxID=668570 RepID=A0A2V2NBZ0_9EURY|nr:metallophosphoesterase family protein [Methanospirillum lacunae]PWR73978.1 hypothetical protein DK846_02095 [Methanospirillum lacunae]
MNLSHLGLLGIILFSLILTFNTISAATTENWEENWAPWVTNTSLTSATINWRQDTTGPGIVQYAKTSSYEKSKQFDEVVTDLTEKSMHHVLISGLEPETSYTYRVRPLMKEDTFSPRKFRTLPQKGPFTFIVLSDTQEGSRYSEDKRFHFVADAIAEEPDVLFILTGGDHASYDDFNRWGIFFHNAEGVLGNTTIYPTIGNHEYHDINHGDAPLSASNYHDAFNMPLTYSFDCAGIRYLILNSQDPEEALLVGSDDPQPSMNTTSSQVPWLREKLTDPSLKGVFTIQHYPDWMNGRKEVDPRLASWDELFREHNISASFAGHVHAYERFLINGTPYFIVGNAGGPAVTVNRTRTEGYQFGTTKRLGYLKVTVNPDANTATAEEKVVGYVKEDNDDETPVIYKKPVVDETVTFPLKR